MESTAETKSFFDDKKRTTTLALMLGAVGGIGIGVGGGIGSNVVLVIGIVALAASGAVWTIQGVKEDEVKDAE